MAQKRIRSYLQETPLIYSRSLSGVVRGEVWLKLENRQPTGSFKVRGALNKLMMIRESGRHIVTGSAGNHGLGVAFAAERLSLAQTTIFIPETAPDAKVNRLRQYDIDLRVTGQTYEDAHQAAVEFSASHAALYISAYDDEHIIAGQGTVGLEIMDRCPEVEIVLVPVGGGGLIAGVAVAVKELSPSVAIIGVQAEASPSAFLSLRDGVPHDPYDHEPTIADGLAGGFGAKPFYIARSLIDQIFLADERSLRHSIFTLLDQDHILAEASGAAAIAPLLAANQELVGRRIVCVISGGNLATSLLREILNEYQSE